MASTNERPYAVVTGASSGIGYELADQFAQHGFDVLVAAEDDGIRSAAERLSSHGTHVESVQADLATPEGVEELYKRIQLSARPLDSIAMNAGVGVAGPFAE